MDNLVGLNNLGNTCYLNSALQIIVNCTVLTKVILSQSFKSEALNIYKKFLIEYKTAKPGNAISPMDIKNLVGSGMPMFGKIRFRKDEISKLYPNIKKAKKLINWAPKTDLNLGLKKTIFFYKKNKFLFKV